MAKVGAKQKYPGLGKCRLVGNVSLPEKIFKAAKSHPGGVSEFIVWIYSLAVQRSISNDRSRTREAQLTERLPDLSKSVLGKHLTIDTVKRDRERGQESSSGRSEEAT